MPTFYHLTARSNVDAIMAEGLRGDHAFPASAAQKPAIQAVYGATPTLMMQRDSYLFHSVLRHPDRGLAMLAVDVEGMPLVADIPALIDHGARLVDVAGEMPGTNSQWVLVPDIEDDADFRYFDAMKSFMDPNWYLNTKSLIEPLSPAGTSAIALTKTAVRLGTIERERLSVVSAERMEAQVQATTNMIRRTLTLFKPNQAAVAPTIHGSADTSNPGLDDNNEFSP